MNLNVADLEIAEIKPSDWNQTLEKQISQIENASFKSGIGDTVVYLKNLAGLEGAVFLVAKIKDATVGYAAGAALENFGEVPGVKQDLHYGLKDTFYLESVAVLPEFRRKNVGKMLLRSILLRAKKVGFMFISGHMKEGYAQRWRGVILNRFDNYYDTGERFEYFRRDVKLGDWSEGCKSLIAVQGIFAGFASLVLVTLLAVPMAPGAVTFPISVGAIIVTVLSIVFLIGSAEQSTDAIDHMDPNVYSNMLLPYNVGVSLFIVGIGLTVSLYIVNLWLNGVIDQTYLSSLLLIWLPLAYSLRRWVSDIVWLSHKENRQAYTLSFEFEEED